MIKEDQYDFAGLQNASSPHEGAQSQQAAALERIAQVPNQRAPLVDDAGHSGRGNVIDWSEAGGPRRRQAPTHRQRSEARCGGRFAVHRLHAGTACSAYVRSEDRLHAAHLPNEADYHVRDFIPGWGRSRHLCAVVHRPSNRVISFGYGDCCLDARAAAYRALARTSGRPRNVARWLMEANTYDALRGMWLRRRKWEA